MNEFYFKKFILKKNHEIVSFKNKKKTELFIIFIVNYRFIIDPTTNE
jgi:hypothetical protein